MIYVKLMENKKIISPNSMNKNTKRPISIFERNGKIIKVYASDKPKTKNNYFKKLSTEYLKEAKMIGLKWIDLIKKDSRKKTIDSINEYRSFREDILHKVNNKINQQQEDIRPFKSYPKIQMTIKDARIHEISLSADKDRTKRSFLQLFDRRLELMYKIHQGKDISIKIHVTITHADNSITNKTYGPFQTKLPALNTDDKYLFALYTLLTSNIYLLSGEYISALGFDIMKLDKRNVIHHKMGRLRLENYLLEHQRPIKSHGKNLCVIDYIWDAIKNKRGFRRYTFDKLKEEIYTHIIDPPMISTYEMISWAKDHHPNTVSIHAFDCRYKKFISHISPESRVSLVYIVKDHHLYPITDKRLKESAIFSNTETSNLLKFMTDIKWSMRHENITKLNNITEITNTEINDSILVLPEDTAIDKAIYQYMKASNYYVEMLKYNNSGMLDAFIDHNNNMIVLNDNYDSRKSVCDHLHDIYKSDDFVWSNQSFTTLAISLYKQRYGNVDESAYNTKTRSVIDSYYPRALIWTNHDIIIDDDTTPDIKSIDISKCYPSILFNNKQLIPVYTIHDTIEEFDPESDTILNNGEYYID